MAQGAVSLPRDAVFEILSRAPVKSVCRFRCASKEWQALVSNPAFVAQHKSRATLLQPLLVTSYYAGENPYTDSGMVVMDTQGTVLREIKGLGKYPTLASSLDHLVCVMCSGAVTSVVDVTTGTVLVASRKPAGYPVDHVIRLGRATVSGLCKAVRIVDYFPVKYGIRSPQTCEVLTIGRHGAADCDWRRAQPPPAPVRLLEISADWAGATVDGLVHFLSSCSLLAMDSVLGFDLDSEEWRKTMEGPLKGDIESWTMHRPLRLAELNKSLCMIHVGVHRTHHRPTDVRCNIWLLTDRDSSTWVKAYSIPTNNWRYEIFQPLRVMPDDAKLIFYYSSLDSLEPRVLRVYDSRAGTCTIAMKMPNNTFCTIGICSLLLLDHFLAPPK